MNSELVLVNELLVVNDLTLRKKDFVECQKALFGKRSAFLYTVVTVCCVAALGVYGIAKQMGIGNSLPIGMMLTLLLCLLVASIFYFIVPKWIGILRYRQYETTNNKPRSVAFYTDHFEMRINGVNTGNYLYAFIRRIIISENLYIIVLPNMVVLPIRHSTIPDEKWNIIQQYINTAMATSRNQPNTKNTDIANDQNRFAKLICLGLVILLCALFLIPHEDRDDVIIGVQYVSGAGPQGIIPYTEVRIYEDSGNSSFLYNESLSHEINYNLPAESTAEYVKEFLANYSGGQS